MLMTTITTEDTFHTTRLHNKRYLNIIQQYMKNLEMVFFVWRTIGKFNKVSPDQVIEQSINKDKKGIGM